MIHARTSAFEQVVFRRAKHAAKFARLQKIEAYVLNVCAILFLLVLIYVIQDWLFGPVRELSETPKVSLQPIYHNKPHSRHNIGAIAIDDRVVSAQLLEPAREMPLLDGVICENCEIQPCVGGQLAKLQNLRESTFINCQMDVGDFVSTCGSSNSLKYLVLSNVKVRPGDFRDLKNWHSLERITLKHTDVNGDDIRDIARATGIKRMSLSHTTITDDEVAAIVEADVFRCLNLSSTNLSESQFLKLCQCRNLERIIIDETDVSASAIPAIKHSKSLRIVYAYNTPLGNGIEEVRFDNGCVIVGSGKPQKTNKQPHLDEYANAATVRLD